MFVSVPGSVSVGAEVSCEISIDGVRHHMRARVAWVHRDGPDQPAALGLAFCALEDDQAAALRSLVTSERSRVWFDGLHESIVGRTEHFEGGAVLRAPLPFLELGRHVRLEAGDGEPRARGGRIANIALTTEPDTNVPTLRVEFALDEERTASEVPEASEDHDDLDVEIVVETAEETPPPTPDMRRWRRAMIVTGALVGVSCIVLAARVASPRASSNALATQVATPARTIVPVLTAPPPPASAPVVEPEAPVAAVATPALPAVELTPAQAAARGPQIQIGDTTVIEIPLGGSTDGEAHYELDEPPGLAINLPRAEIAFPFGDTRVGKGGVQFVRLTRRHGGVQVRLHFTSERAPRYAVEVGAGRVRISVQPN